MSFLEGFFLLLLLLKTGSGQTQSTLKGLIQFETLSSTIWHEPRWS